MDEAFTPQLRQFSGYSKYVITKEPYANEIIDLSNVFHQYGAKIKYVGKFFTYDYSTVDVYGVENCTDETALLIKMAL